MAKASLLNAGQVQPSHRSEGPRHAGRDSAGQSRWAVGRSSSIAIGAWGAHPSLKGTVGQVPLSFHCEGLV